MLIPKLVWSEATVGGLSPVVTFLLPPSPEEIEELPHSFRCFSCLEERDSKTDFGGSVAGKRICSFCIPYVDEWDVRAMIAFDRIHGFEA